MTTVHVRFYKWITGSKRKSPNPKFEILVKEDIPTQDDSYSLLIPSEYGGLPLAFVSVSGPGSANGHYVIGKYPNPDYTPTPLDPPPFQDPQPSGQFITVNLDSDSEATISVWYMPVGQGSGQPGAYIDSFNVDTGTFFFDPSIANDFVTVSPDAALTGPANELGWVPTASAETITSHDAILSVPFLEWIVTSQSGPASVINGKALKVGAKSSVTAVAFFGTKNRKQLRADFADFYEATWHRLYPGEAVDAPKPGDPTPPQWRAVIKRITVLLAMNASMESVEPRNLARVQKQITLSVQALTEGLNKILQPRV